MSGIRWSASARRDLGEIHAYIARDSQIYARRLIDRIKQAVESIPRFPEAGSRVPEWDRNDIREIFVGNYRVIYRAGVEVIIVAVIHAARNLQDLE
jgi:plasmid stabilization system protein ParE